MSLRASLPRIAILGLVAAVGWSCDSGGPPTAGEVRSGTVTGRVTMGGAGASGIVVRLLESRRQDGTWTTIATTTTDPNGAYQFSNVSIGEKSVSIAIPSGTRDRLGGGVLWSVKCWGSRHVWSLAGTAAEQDVTLLADGTATANFTCEPMIVHGKVILNGKGVAGVVMELVTELHTLTIATTTTREDGTYVFERVREGIYNVHIKDPSNLICWSSWKEVAVFMGWGTNIANFVCTQSG